MLRTSRPADFFLKNIWIWDSVHIIGLIQGNTEWIGFQFICRLPVLFQIHGGGNQCKHVITAFLPLCARLYALLFLVPWINCDLVLVWSSPFLCWNRERRRRSSAQGLCQCSWWASRTIPRLVDFHWKLQFLLCCLSALIFLVQVWKVCLCWSICQCNLVPWSATQGACPAVSKPHHSATSSS